MHLPSWSRDAANPLDKLEESVLEIEKRRITKEEGRKAQAAMQALEVKDKAAGPGIKSEDVDFIVCVSVNNDSGSAHVQIHQMSCTRTEAEDALKTSGGDLIKALLQMVKPAKRARSVDGGAQA